MNPDRRFFRWIIVLCILIIAACASPEQKKTKYFESGKAYYDRGEFDKAVIEFKNAIQIDPKFADAHYMLGMSYLKQRDFRQAYNAFLQAVEANPDQLDAQVGLGSVDFGPLAAVDVRGGAVGSQSRTGADGFAINRSVVLTRPAADGSTPKAITVSAQVGVGQITVKEK